MYDKDTSIEILRCFGDKDFQDSAGDAFNSVTWSQDLATGDPLVIVASETAKIKVLNVRTGEIVRVREQPILNIYISAGTRLTNI